ncbi:MAG: GIY-YIG nuclease family protein [Akkermansia sp.]|nr:GIY-YIG nuclease family protein [Akkermansia sp.]
MKGKTYSLYRHTAPTGKVYIGITSQNPVTRWANGRGYQHNQHFNRAIQKYGWDSFRHEVLLSGLTQEEAEEKERELIAKHKANNPAFGFNVLAGGDAREGLPGELNGMYDVHLFGEANGMFGRTHSTETREKISRARTGTVMSDEQKARLSQLFRGAGNPMAGVQRCGEANPFHGKHHTQETRDKISKARLGKFAREQNPNARAVICLTTGEVFGSLSAAVEKYGVRQGNLSTACKNPTRSCGKTREGVRLKWMYYDEYLNTRKEVKDDGQEVL